MPSAIAPPEPTRPGVSARSMYVMHTLLDRNPVWAAFAGWLERTPPLYNAFTSAERFAKNKLFGCRMCAQCALPATGYACPMTCPKQLRNGPCGGVGHGRQLRGVPLYALARGSRPTSARRPKGMPRTCAACSDQSISASGTRARGSTSGSGATKGCGPTTAQSRVNLTCYMTTESDGARRGPTSKPLSGLQARLQSGEFVVTSELGTAARSGRQGLPPQSAAFAPLDRRRERDRWPERGRAHVQLGRLHGRHPGRSRAGHAAAVPRPQPHCPAS